MQYNFTHNSQEADSKTIFVLNKYNKKYKNLALENGCKKIIQSAELAKYYDFKNIKIIAITGTNGKTTTANIISYLLSNLGYKCGLLGTNGFFINKSNKQKQINKPTLTTPMQVDIFKNIQYALKQKCDFFIMEVSSHAIEQNRIEGLIFDAKICTNITSDHLDYHKTLQNYIDIKNSFLYQSANDKGIVIANNDDKNTKQKNIKNLYTYGLDNKSNYQAKIKNKDFLLNGKIIHSNKKYKFSSNLIGKFNMYNILASVACVNLLTNKSLDKICKKLELVNGVSGRMQIVNKKPLIVVDFAHTSDGLKQVFKSFKKHTKSNNTKIIAMFGAGGDRDKQKRAKMGKIASKYCNIVILTNDNPRYEDEIKIINDIKKGIKPNFNNLFIEPNRTKAIELAISMANKSDIVLALGKGCEKYQTIRDKKIKFEDKKAIKKALRKQKANK